MVVPVIDFSKLDGTAAERAETMAQIDNGCEEWGFFQLVNHGVPKELLDRVKKVCLESYRLREAAFMESEPVRTLEGLMAAERRGEAAAPVDDMDWEDIFYLHDDNQWPSNPPEFKETMREYRAALRGLAERVMEAMDENLGLDKGRMRRAFTGDGRHAPFFGTKVLRGGEWVDVQPLADAIVVNTGDQVEVLSNGRYRSAWHRVLPMRDGNRRSVASFYNPAFEATISPAVGAGGEYPEYVFGEYMDVYAKQKFDAKEPRFEAVKAPKSA
ncbi:hypothetical protein OsJ_17130 [Oryza sativa Japonica Group]|uniref:Fe2OG dioxygenase domain-containing protein n=1 Tax=Oryza sativa subsp. japonica TaxID=39947 RepID=B9FMG7_ORYSJ|nr:hypothetical protein OsJ_17130 [Oryza sativa Japonica Group]